MKLFTWYEYRKYKWVYMFWQDKETYAGLSYNINNDMLIYDQFDKEVLNKQNFKEKKIDKIYQEEILQQIWEVKIL